MTILPSGLETTDTGSQGWNAVHSSNMEKLDDLLVEPFGADEKFGTSAIADDATTQAAPEAATASAPTINTVSGTGDDATINGNFSALETTVNALITDVDDIRTVAEGTIDYCDALKTKLNALLAKLRKTGGCGVLAD